MITKEQAMTADSFICSIDYKLNGLELADNKDLSLGMYKTVRARWRANGKCKTWKTRPNEFKLPIKHGLYSYGYLTQDNAHLFEVAP